MPQENQFGDLNSYKRNLRVLFDWSQVTDKRNKFTSTHNAETSTVRDGMSLCPLEKVAGREGVGGGKEMHVDKGSGRFGVM